MGILGGMWAIKGA